MIEKGEQGGKGEYKAKADDEVNKSTGKKSNIAFSPGSFYSIF